MSYAHGTPFLNLAQTVGTDHRDWFDENEAKLDLDTKMKTLWDGAADTATILASLQENVADLQTDVTTLDGIVSGHTSTITTINESLVLINTALNALNTQVTNKFDSAGIADPYDATHGIYSVGDVVTYNGQRYICSTAVTAAEPFDVSKWTAKDIQAEIDELKAENVVYLDILTSAQSYLTVLNRMAAAFSSYADNLERCKLIIERPTQTDIYEIIGIVASDNRFTLSRTIATSTTFSIFDIVVSGTSSIGFVTAGYESSAISEVTWTSMSNTNLEAGTKIKLVIQ